MKRKIAWVSILLLMIGMLGGCKRSPDEVSQLAGAATEVVRQEETETVQKEEEMIPPADQPEAEEPPRAGETVEEKEEQITPPEPQEPQKPEVEEPSVEPEPQEPSEGKDEPEENEPEEEIDLNAGNRFSPRKPMEPGYDKYYCDATIDDEFEPGVLTVRLINAVSYPNKKWPLSTFACVDPVSAVHMNYYDDPEVIARKNLDTYTQSFKITLKEKTKEAVLKAIRELEKMDIVYFAQPLYTQGNSGSTIDKDASLDQAVQTTNTVSRSSTATDSGYRSNDSYVENQYAIDQIKLPAAWNISIGTTGLKVGVIDSGVDASHLDIDAQVNYGFNFIGDGTSTFLDENKHGTHVAGILGAVGNNARGVAGTAWQIEMVPFKAWSTLGGPNERIIRIINRAEQEGIKLLNMSGGGGPYDGELEAAIDEFSGLIVFSAGNQSNNPNLNNDTHPYYPASYNCDNIISVCNVDWNDQLATSSHYGATSVDLAAPGEGIYSTLPDGLYGYGWGTSMAAPYVTGVAALIWSANPNLTPAQVKNAILAGVDPVANLNGKCVTGGRLNAYRALTYALTEYDSDALTGDINGDGREDLLFYRGMNTKRRFTVFYGKADGSFEQASTYYFSASLYSPNNQVYLADVNGDGKKEVIVYWWQNSYRRFTIYTYSPTADSFTAGRLNSAKLHNATANPDTFLVGDANGDQKEDIIVHWGTANGKRRTSVYKGMIDSNGYAALAECIDSPESVRVCVATDKVYAGDVNGDGRSDLIVHWAQNGLRRFLTYTANADGTYADAVRMSSTKTFDLSVYPSQFYVADATGDGKDDFIVHWKNANNKRCMLVYNGTVADGLATFAEGRDVLTSTRTYVASDLAYPGDFNGDGKTDLVIQWGLNGKRQILVYHANASGGYNEGINISTPQYLNATLYPHSTHILDANGDGKDDLIDRWMYGTISSIEYGYTHTHTYKGNANGFDATTQTSMLYYPFYDYR